MVPNPTDRDCMHLLERPALLIAGLALATTAPAQAQNPASPLTTRPAPFESWQPALPLDRDLSPARVQPAAAAGSRARNGLIGGAIGAVAGVAFCTVVSNVINDPGTGFSTCTAKGFSSPDRWVSRSGSRWA